MDAYRKKVIDTFFQYGRLKQIPVQLKKRQVILIVPDSDRLPSSPHPVVEDYQTRRALIILRALLYWWR